MSTAANAPSVISTLVFASMSMSAEEPTVTVLISTDPPPAVISVFPPLEVNPLFTILTSVPPSISIPLPAVIVVSETFNSGSNLFSAQVHHSWFGLRGATDLAIQMPTMLESTRVEKRFGDRIKGLEGWGVKTFADGARALIDVQIDASAWA